MSVGPVDPDRSLCVLDDVDLDLWHLSRVHALPVDDSGRCTARIRSVPVRHYEIVPRGEDMEGATQICA